MILSHFNWQFLLLLCFILLKDVSSDTFTISSDNEYTCNNCQNDYIICTSSSGCNIKCDDTNACRNTIILSDNDLYVNCPKENACSNTQVYCGDLSLATQTTNQISFPDSYPASYFSVSTTNSVSCSIVGTNNYGWYNGTFGCYGDGIDTCEISGTNDNGVYGTTNFICNTEWTSGSDSPDCICDSSFASGVNMKCYSDNSNYYDNQCDCETGCTLSTFSLASPSILPTNIPTDRPTNTPSDKPSDRPSDRPTDFPTNIPTDRPTNNPTNKPTDNPTDAPTPRPTDTPTPNPTHTTPHPTDSTVHTTGNPTGNPSGAPSVSPTVEDTTNNPTTTEEPTEQPTEQPTNGQETTSIATGTNTNANTIANTNGNTGSSGGGGSQTTIAGETTSNDNSQTGNGGGSGGSGSDTGIVNTYDHGYSGHNSGGTSFGDLLLQDIGWIIGILVALCVCGICLFFTIVFYARKVKHVEKEYKLFKGDSLKEKRAPLLGIGAAAARGSVAKRSTMTSNSTGSNNELLDTPKYDPALEMFVKQHSGEGIPRNGIRPMPNLLSNI